VCVKTTQGMVRAKQVVLASGAWVTRLRQLQRAFTVIADYMVVTEPIPNLLSDIGWTSHAAIADSREMCYYFRKTHDDRIAIGGGSLGVAYGNRVGGRAFTSSRIPRLTARGLTWFFPQLEGVRIEKAWCGPLDMAPSQTPFFVTLASGNVHVGLGFSGHGLTPTKLGGKTLASLVLGAKDEWSSMPVVAGSVPGRVPPEPLRYPMLRIMQWALEGKDRDGELGRGAGLAKSFVSRALSAYVASKMGNRRSPSS
jgi:glycine/D-amino acid oxidase-like deaminating enzyme